MLEMIRDKSMILFKNKNLYENSYYLDITHAFNFVEVVRREYEMRM